MFSIVSPPSEPRSTMISFLQFSGSPDKLMCGRSICSGTIDARASRLLFYPLFLALQGEFHFLRTLMLTNPLIVFPFYYALEYRCLFSDFACWALTEFIFFQPFFYTVFGFSLYQLFPPPDHPQRLLKRGPDLFQPFTPGNLQASRPNLSKPFPLGFLVKLLPEVLFPTFGGVSKFYHFFLRAGPQTSFSDALEY